jgi:putative addiction module component (TIGR02574 family)
MTDAAERLKPELARLSPHERAELARFLINSLDEGADADADAAWDAELARRMEEITGGRVAGEPVDAVFAELRAKYS